MGCPVTWRSRCILGDVWRHCHEERTAADAVRKPPAAASLTSLRGKQHGPATPYPTTAIPLLSTRCEGFGSGCRGGLWGADGRLPSAPVSLGGKYYVKGDRGGLVHRLRDWCCTGAPLSNPRASCRPASRRNRSESGSATLR